MKYLSVFFSLLLANTGSAAALQATIQSSPVVIAHRGVPAYLPEHTLAGAAMAYAFGADYIELDIVMTKDGRLIVNHDVTLEDTTDVETVFPEKKREDGKWYAIDLTLAEIQRLAVHERVIGASGTRRFPGRFPYQKSHFEIATFEEMIELVQGLNAAAGGRTGIYPELKDLDFHTNEGRDIVKPFVEILSRYGYTAKDSGAVIQSFDAKALKRLRSEFETQLPLVQLIGGKKDAVMKSEKGLADVATYADGVGPSIKDLFLPASFVFSPLLANAKKNKLIVHAYTLRADQLPAGVTFDAVALKLYAGGVDGIFTDNADQLVTLVSVLQKSVEKKDPCSAAGSRHNK